MAMITLRKDRIVYFAIFVLAILFLTWKANYFGSDAENEVEYEPALNTLDKPTTGDDFEAPPKTTPNGTPSNKGKYPEKPPSIGKFTTVPEGAHVYGFTLIDNLYLRDGTFFIVTPDVNNFPKVDEMISQPKEMEKENLAPTDKEMTYLKLEDVDATLGKHAIPVDGVSVIVYDHPQFMPHLYHWWGEIILGLWRVLSFEGRKANAVLSPNRFILPFSSNGEYRDPAGVDGPLMRAGFPNAQIEESDYWQDLIKLNATVVFDRVLLVNRVAAHRHPLNEKWFKMIAGTMSISVTPGKFWEPLRQTLVRNIVGYLPEPERSPASVHEVEESLPKLVVTYISRQGTPTRHLSEEADRSLVEAMKELQKEGICEFVEAKMETLELREQVEIAAKSTIIIGVHGNGLTHQLWMPASPRSTVFEIFAPEGYLFDYEMLARNMGHRHYAVWNDKVVTYPEGTYHDGVNTEKDNFHGTTIPVDAAILVKHVRERLSVKI